MAPIEWPVTIRLGDGRTFLVERHGDADLRVCAAGTDDWRVMGWPYGVPSVGAVVGRTLRWWRETTGEPVIIGARRSY
jgi:hypothetical protein